MKNIKSNAKGLVIACIGAVLAQSLKLPLPWLLGPLIAILLTGATGTTIGCDPRWRKCGQVIIGMALGLYFTPALVVAISAYGSFILIGLVWAIVLNVMLALLQYKFNRLDEATAWFSSSIGSASEMVNIAEHYHAQIDKVVAAHSLRIVLLVILIPIFMEIFLAVDFAALLPVNDAKFNGLTLLLMFLIALMIGKFLDYLHVLNAWLLGPLLLIGCFSYMGVLSLKLPAWMIHFGQLCIGWSLASKFPFDFLQQQQRFIAVTLGLNSLALLLSLVLAWCLTMISDADLHIMILGFAPGGIAEMSLTAKAIGIAVPIVVAFQLSRLIFVIITTTFFYQLFKKTLARFYVR